MYVYLHLSVSVGTENGIPALEEERGSGAHESALSHDGNPVSQ